MCGWFRGLKVALWWTHLLSRFVEYQWLIDSWYTHIISFGGSNLMQFSSEMELLWCFSEKSCPFFLQSSHQIVLCQWFFLIKQWHPSCQMNINWYVPTFFHCFSFQWVFLSTEIDRFFLFHLLDDRIELRKPDKCEHCKWNVLQHSNFPHPKKASKQS